MATRTRALLAAVLAACLAMPALFLLLVLAALTAGVLGGCSTLGAPVLVGPKVWSAEQASNAATITGVVTARQLPRRAAVIAVATAIAESGLRNLAYGDRDSLGVFQQRPSQGWGPPSAVSNPTTATGTFLDRLLAVPGWATLAPGVAEQAVQRSHFPERYGPQEAAAAALVALAWTGPDNPIPTPPGTQADQAALVAATAGLGGCPDTGGSDTPLLPGGFDARAMPPGYTLPTDPPARAVVAFAAAQLGKPYVWGATGPGSFDCSGLVQAAWAAAGVPISRGTSTQVHDGDPVTDLGHLQPGDLLFIPGSNGTPAHPGHVGLYAGRGLVIDAYDSRRGVIVEQLSSWAPKIVAVRRVSGPTAPGLGDPR
jgi:cell wall-associated NlpC family hydrolase